VSRVGALTAEQEPQKIALLGMKFSQDRFSSSQVATETGAISTAPPGLHARPDAANTAGAWQPELAHRLPYGANGSMGASAPVQWQQRYSPDELGMKSLLTTPGGMWNTQDASAKEMGHPMRVGVPAQVAPSATCGVDQSNDGYFDASRDLQRSLEQLLRLQSEHVNPKLESKTSKLAAGPMFLPSVPADDVISTMKMER